MDVPDGDGDQEELATHSTVGMCSECTDVVSLVALQSSNSGTANESTHYALPDGLNFTIRRNDTIHRNVHNKTEGGLSWMGDLLSPRFRALSSWSYANVTFLKADQFHIYFDEDDPPSEVHIDQGPANVTATVCSLYPCLRTYTASISNNNMLER